MVRVKRGKISIKRRRSVLKAAKGYMWGGKTKERAARERLMHAWSHAYRDRKKKKREIKKLWQIKIKAAAREEGMSYSKFMAALKRAHIEIDKKILAELAEKEPQAFKKIAEIVK